MANPYGRAPPVQAHAQRDPAGDRQGLDRWRSAVTRIGRGEGRPERTKQRSQTRLEPRFDLERVCRPLNWEVCALRSLNLHTKSLLVSGFVAASRTRVDGIGAHERAKGRRTKPAGMHSRAVMDTEPDLDLGEREGHKVSDRGRIPTNLIEVYENLPR